MEQTPKTKPKKVDEMISLKETSDQLLSIFLQLEDSGGELTPELEAGLTKYTQHRKEKAERIVKFSRRMKSMGAALKAEAAELKEMAARKLKAAANLEKYLLAEMQALDEKKLHTELFTISRAKIGTPKVDLAVEANLSKVNPDFIRIIPAERKLDKKAVLAFLKKEEMIPSEVGIYSVGLFEVIISERLSVS